MDSPIIRLIRLFLEQSRYGVVSSVSSDGWPQSAYVGIAVTPGLEIIFDTLKSSRKYPNLTRNPFCSVVVIGPGEKTIQMEGIATEPKDAALKHYQDAYFATWPEGRAHLSWTGIAYLVVRPVWIRYSDYDQAPPLIEEIKFKPTCCPPPAP